MLIGSTDKCGTGVNVQTHLAAMHHCDCPWKPSSIEQREGRGLRQGNENDEVAVYRYVTKGTFDAYRLSMQSLIVWLIVGCIVVRVCILILILSMWIKQRRYETGILLSIGITKGNIVFQYIVEVLVIAVVAFGLSYFTSNLISQGVSDLIFNQVAESQPMPELELPDDGSEYLDITGQYIPYDTSKIEMVESVEVKVSPNNLLYVYVFGAFLIILSVSAASVTVIQMKPKKILSQMN